MIQPAISTIHLTFLNLLDDDIGEGGTSLCKSWVGCFLVRAAASYFLFNPSSRRRHCTSPVSLLDADSAGSSRRSAPPLPLPAAPSPGQGFPSDDEPRTPPLNLNHFPKLRINRPAVRHSHFIFRTILSQTIFLRRSPSISQRRRPLLLADDAPKPREPAVDATDDAPFRRHPATASLHHRCKSPFTSCLPDIWLPPMHLKLSTDCGFLGKSKTKLHNAKWFCQTGIVTVFEAEWPLLATLAVTMEEWRNKSMGLLYCMKDLRAWNSQSPIVLRMDTTCACAFLHISYQTPATRTRLIAAFLGPSHPLAMSDLIPPSPCLSLSSSRSVVLVRLPPATEESPLIGGEHAFVKQLCRNSVIQSFTSFGGNLYGLKKYSTTLVRVEFNDQSAQFEEVIGGDLFDEPSSRPKWSGMYAIGYITENCGEILLVTKIYFAKRHWQVENIRVFRADLCARKWVEMESIGERTIFLGSVGGIFCINSNNANVRNNCIYFIEENDRNIYVFDLEDMSVSINLPCPHVGKKSIISRWIL
nr:F-box/kelch-repeat protein At1g57790-like [Ipomoea batatas]